MGVKGLWKMISPSGIQEDPKYCTLAIDVSIWIHQYKGMNEVDAIYWLSRKILKLLYHNIKPIFVFDGPPNEMKRKVIEQRKKENFRNLIKDIINNKICRICKTKLRICKHGGLIKEQNKDLNLISKIEWGNIYTKNDHVISIKESEPIKRINLNVNYELNDIENFAESSEYSTQQKLKMLVKLRGKRKEKLGFDNKTMFTFSISQLKNVKQRNYISYYIRKLETSESKKIQSDSNKTFLLTKELKINKKPTNNKIITEINSDDELDAFLGIDEKESEDKCDVLSEIKKVKVQSDNDEKLFSGFFNKKGAENKEKITGQENTRMDYEDEIRFSKFQNGTTIDLSGNNETREHNNSMMQVKKNEPSEIIDFLGIETIIKQILKILNLPFIDSPSEADAQCAWFCKSGLVNGVITEDNDILLHGGTVYKNFFRKNKHIIKYDPCNIEKVLELTIDDLVNLGYILGSDYTVGIKGVGYKRALKYLRSDEFRKMNIDTYTRLYKTPKINKEWTPCFGIIDTAKFLRFCAKNNLDKERIGELNFFFEKIYATEN